MLLRAAVAGRLRGVEEEVHEDARELPLLGAHARGPAVLSPHRGMVANGMSGHAKGVLDGARDLDRQLDGFRAAAEVAEVLDGASNALGAFARVLERAHELRDLLARRLGIAAKPIEHELHVGDDGRERVVDLVLHASGHGADRGQALGHGEAALKQAALAHVAEDHDAAQRAAGVERDGSDAALDEHERSGRRLSAGRRARGEGEPSIARKAGDAWPRRRALQDRQRSAARVDEADHLVDLLSDALPRGHVHERLGRAIHERDAILGVGGEDGIAKRLERRREPLFARGERFFEARLVKRDLDGDPELARVERLLEVAKRGGLLRALERGVVREAREIDDAYRVPLTKQLRGLDPIEVAVEPDVHQDEREAQPCGGFEGVEARRGDLGDEVPCVHEDVAKAFGDVRIVFHDEDRG